MSVFSAELLKDLELLINCIFLVNYLNPSLFVVLVNNNNDLTLTEAMNDTDSARFMVIIGVSINALIIA